MKITEEAFATALDALATAFNHTITDRDLIRLWYPSIADRDPKALARACENLPRQQQFFPKLYELLEATQDAARQIAVERAEMEAADPRPDCPFCHGTGWGQPEEYVKSGMTYTSVRPCGLCNPQLAQKAAQLVDKAKAVEYQRDGKQKAIHYQSVEGIGEGEPADDVAVDWERQARTVRAMRAGLNAVQVPAHSHCDRGDCPACTTRHLRPPEETAARIMAAIRRELADGDVLFEEAP